MNQGTRHSFPPPGFLPLSNPNPSNVGDGHIIRGDGGGGGAPAAAGGGGGGGNSSMSFAEILELMSKSGGGGRISQSSSRSSVIPKQIVHPPISIPTQQLRLSCV